MFSSDCPSCKRASSLKQIAAAAANAPNSKCLLRCHNCGRTFTREAGGFIEVADLPISGKQPSEPMAKWELTDDDKAFLRECRICEV